MFHPQAVAVVLAQEISQGMQKERNQKLLAQALQVLHRHLPALLQQTDHAQVLLLLHHHRHLDHPLHPVEVQVAVGSEIGQEPLHQRGGGEAQLHVQQRFMSVALLVMLQKNMYWKYLVPMALFAVLI